MAEFLILLLMQVTVFSSVTAFIIIAVKQLFKCRIPPEMGMIMWVVLLCRLVFPILPESRISIYNFIPAGKEIMYSLTNDVGDGISDYKNTKTAEDNPYVIPIPENVEKSEETVSQSKNERPDTIGEYIINDIGVSAERNAEIINSTVLAVYVLGAVICLSVNTLVYVHVKRRVMRSSELCVDEDILKLYFSTTERLGLKNKNIPALRYGNTSMLVGCIRPTIVIREDMDRDEALFVFAHELCHYRYMDNPIIMFSAFVSCMFWYNPLIWMVRRMLRDDVEMLCDSRTIDTFRLSTAEYAKMICRHTLYTSYVAGCHMSASGRSLKTRLKSISHGKNDRFFPKAVSLALCVAMIAVCLTNPIVSQNSDYEVYLENFSEISGISERVMALSSSTTVSGYLSNVALLLEKKISPELKRKMGNGSLENFKRICRKLDCLERGIKDEVSKLHGDEVLNVKSCSVIMKSLIAILADGTYSSNRELSLIPEYISETEMNSVLLMLDTAEAESLMKWYNKGVEGADVSFARYYTPAMMELILSRINDEWVRNKFCDFYSEIDYSRVSEAYYSDELISVGKLLKHGSTFYALDPDITTNEETKLRSIIGVAQAGQRSDVYYLKELEDGCTSEIGQYLFKQCGYDTEKMLNGYAEIGETSFVYLTEESCSLLSRAEIEHINKRLHGTGYTIYGYYEPVGDEESDNSRYFSLKDADGIDEVLAVLNRIAYKELREDSPTVMGLTDGDTKEAIEYAYRMGFVSAEDGVIEPRTRISFGESIACAYKLVSYAVNQY